MFFEIVNGDLFLYVEVDDEFIVYVCVLGKWDDGNWYDLVVISGWGVIDFYVDGFFVVYEFGEVFFVDFGKVERVIVGKDFEGVWLFGEV